jgi:hypothetical protein
MLIKPVQRYVKRQVERQIFSPVLLQQSFDPTKAKVRLNWGSPSQPDLLISDLIAAANSPLSLIRPEEFRKNAVKAGWELWDANPAQRPNQSNPKVKTESGGEVRNEN